MRFLKRLWAFLTFRTVAKRSDDGWEVLPFNFRMDWCLHVDADLEKVRPHVLSDKEDL